MRNGAMHIDISQGAIMTHWIYGRDKKTTKEIHPLL